MPQNSWDREELFFEGAAYFEQLFLAIDQARRSVDLETYIIESDAIGKQLLVHLQMAAARGIRVRLLVDGVGSLNWIQSNLVEALSHFSVRVFHPLPWPFARIRSVQRERRFSFLELAALANHRNHRKVSIIDGDLAFVGSCNLSGVHLSWRDTTVAVSGLEVLNLLKAFERAWHGGRSRSQVFDLSIVRLNESPDLRQRLRSDLLARMRDGRRLWVTNPYFVPLSSFILAMCSCSKQGGDVRLLFPAKSDVPFVRWVGLLYYETLLKAGVRIFEYSPHILHAKTMIIDDWATVGSSNMNQRSFIYDLEVDIEITKKPNREALARQFLVDLEHSVEVQLSDLKKRAWWQFFLGRILYFLFRRLL